MKKILSSFLVITTLFFTSCSKDDDNNTSLGNPKKVILNNYTNEGYLSEPSIFEFGYNENKLITSIKEINDTRVVNTTISYDGEKRINQIVETTGTNEVVKTISYSGDEITISVSGQANPTTLNYNPTTDSYDYTVGSSTAILKYDSKGNLIQYAIGNQVSLSKIIDSSVKGIFTGQDKFLSIFLRTQSLSNPLYLVFCDVNAFSQVFLDGNTFTIHNESMNGSITSAEYFNIASQQKILDVSVIY